MWWENFRELNKHQRTGLKMIKKSLAFAEIQLERTNNGYFETRDVRFLVRAEVWKNRVDKCNEIIKKVIDGTFTFEECMEHVKKLRAEMKFLKKVEVN